MTATGFRTRMAAGEVLAGTFLRTPAHDLVEVLASSGLDFVCLDTEHSAFDRARLDACLAVGRALGFPLLVRVASADASVILQALDSGAEGVVVPHVDSAAKAAQVAKAARFGHYGRGFAGGTRWGGFNTFPMADMLVRSHEETAVIVQIEEPEGVEAAEAIAATDGVDALFVGPADLSVAYGHSDTDNADLAAAMERVGAATMAAGRAFATFVPGLDRAAACRAAGVTVFVAASEQAWVRVGAHAAADGLHALAKAE